MRPVFLFIAILTLFTLEPAGAFANTLERMRDTGVIKIGYREDAVPFSYLNDQGQPAGYTIDLCSAVVNHLKALPGLESLTIEYVPVQTETRFAAVMEHRIDLLCGATTVTLARREQVDFSVPVFVTGGSLLYRADGPQNLPDLEGQSIGVRKATTMVETLANLLDKFNVKASVVEVDDHAEGIDKLASGVIAAYFGDRAILSHLLSSEHAAAGVKLSDVLLSYEPYALAMEKGDDEFRLAVDRAISRIYRSPEIAFIYRNSFGERAPGQILETLYLLNALPE
jgi:polar amino acid transport system substrate-binding protein/glutamate/aspartate transport system substrate-binding protein